MNIGKLVEGIIAVIQGAASERGARCPSCGASRMSCEYAFDLERVTYQCGAVVEHSGPPLAEKQVVKVECRKG